MQSGINSKNIDLFLRVLCKHWYLKLIFHIPLVKLLTNYKNYSMNVKFINWITYISFVY